MIEVLGSKTQPGTDTRVRVLIFDAAFEGHRMQYVRAILDALRPFSVSTTLVCGHGVERSQEFATHLGPIAGQFQLDDDATHELGAAPYKAGVSRFKDLRRAIMRHRPDHIYVPDADGVMQVSGLARALGWRLSRPGMEIEGLLMRGRFAYESKPLTLRTRATIKALELSPFDVIHHLDPIAYAFLQRHGSALADRLRLLPEAVERIDDVAPRIARARLGIPVEGRYLGCLGALSARKGAALLIQAFLEAKLPSDCRLLLIGEADFELRALLRTQFAAAIASGRIIHLDRYVSQEEFHLGLKASDVVCAPYRRQIGSSGIVVRAAAAGRPVLGSDFGWVGRVIRDFELGETWDVENVSAFAAKAADALSEARNYRAGANARRFSAYHSIENFGAHWTSRLRERLRIGQENKLLGWEWPASS